MSEVSGNEAADHDEDGGREANEHSIMCLTPPGPPPTHTHIKKKKKKKKQAEYLKSQIMNISVL